MKLPVPKCPNCKKKVKKVSKTKLEGCGCTVCEEFKKGRLEKFKCSGCKVFVIRDLTALMPWAT